MSSPYCKKEKYYINCPRCEKSSIDTGLNHCAYCHNEINRDIEYGKKMDSWIESKRAK